MEEEGKGGWLVSAFNFHPSVPEEPFCGRLRLNPAHRSQGPDKGTGMHPAAAPSLTLYNGPSRSCKSRGDQRGNSLKRWPSGKDRNEEETVMRIFGKNIPGLKGYHLQDAPKVNFHRSLECALIPELLVPTSKGILKGIGKWFSTCGS